MTTLTMRCIKGDFVVTGPDVPPNAIQVAPRSKGLRATIHYPGSPIKQSGRDASKRRLGPHGRRMNQHDR